jgi:EmrB/QacA subfamily drug resistance transporter
MSGKAYERRWVTLGVICLALVVITIDNTVLNVALPTIVRELGATGSQLQWIVDSYVIVFACLLLTAGALGDKYGRKGALMCGVALFGAFSALASFATSPDLLIVCRGLMGIGGALIYPTTLSILTNTFTGRERARAIGIWAGISGVGIAIGPLVGGFLVEHFSWGAVFLVNVPICVIAFTAAAVFVPKSRDPDNRPLDPLGSLLSILMLIGLLYAIIQAPEAGWTATNVLVGFAVGLVFGGLFAAWELHTADPMLDLRFFENPRFSAASGAITLTFMALFGTIFLLTQYMQLVLGYSTLKAGAVLLPHAIVLMVLAPLSPRWVHRWGSKRVVATGMAIASFGLLLMTTFTVHSSTLSVIVIMMVLATGFAQILAPATESILGSLPREKAGVGSAMNDTTRQIGGAIGVAVLGSLVASTYRSQMAAKLDGTVRAGVVHAASDSVGAAIGAARDVAAPAAHRVVAAAQSSFVSGMHVAVIVAAAIIAVGAVGVLRWLPARMVDDATERMPDVDAVVPKIEPVNVEPALSAADLSEAPAYERERT